MNVNSAGSPSASVAVSVYVVAGWTASGVPASVPPVVAPAAGGVYVSPAGSSAGVSVYVSRPSPFVAAGNVSVTAVPTVYRCGSTVAFPKLGCRSAGPGAAGAAPVANANVTAASFPCASTTVNRYCRCGVAAVGVPTIRPPSGYRFVTVSLAGGSYVSPAGNAGVTTNVSTGVPVTVGAGNVCSAAWFSGCRAAATVAVPNVSGFAATVSAKSCVAVLPFTSVTVSV